MACSMIGRVWPCLAFGVLLDHLLGNVIFEGNFDRESAFCMGQYCTDWTGLN